MPTTPQHLEDRVHTFFDEIADAVSNDDWVRQRQAFTSFETEVLEAARHGVESFFAWHALATCAELGTDRINYFYCALETLDYEMFRCGPKTATDEWGYEHSKADCLYEIGRVYAARGRCDLAQRFYIRALPHASQAEDLREAAGLSGPGLEGEIACRLLTLDASPNPGE